MANLFFGTIQRRRTRKLQDIESRMSRTFRGNHYNFQTSTALTFYNSLFSPKFMHPLPISWDSTSEQFFANHNKFHPIYWPSYFNTYIVACFIGFGSCLTVILNFKHLPPQLVMASFGFGTMSALFWMLYTFNILYLEEEILGHKRLKCVSLSLRRRFPHNNFNSDPYWRLVSILIHLMILVLASIPPFLTVLGVSVDIDPFVYSLSKIFGFEFRLRRAGQFTVMEFQIGGRDLCIFIVLRILASAICSFECCRFLAFYFTKLSHCCVMFVKSLDILLAQRRLHHYFHHYSLYINSYRSLDIASASYRFNLEKPTGIMMGIGFLVSIVSHVGTVKGKFLPFAFYWLMPTIAIINLFLQFLLLSVSAEVREKSAKLLRKWELEIAQNKSKFKGSNVVERRLRSMRPIALSCSGFFELNTDSLSGYFYWLVIRTLDCTLMLQDIMPKWLNALMA